MTNHRSEAKIYICKHLWNQSSNILWHIGFPLVQFKVLFLWNRLSTHGIDPILCSFAEGIIPFHFGHGNLTATANKSHRDQDPEPLLSWTAGHLIIQQVCSHPYMNVHCQIQTHSTSSAGSHRFLHRPRQDILFLFPILPGGIKCTQNLSWAYETSQSKVWLLPYQRLLFHPGRWQNHSLSWRYTRSQLNLKLEKFRTQIAIIVNGDLVPIFSGSFLSSEMAPRKICSVTFLETEMELNSLQFPWISFSLEDERNIYLFPVNRDFLLSSQPFKDDRVASQWYQPASSACSHISTWPHTPVMPILLH